MRQRKRGGGDRRGLQQAVTNARRQLRYARSRAADDGMWPNRPGTQQMYENDVKRCERKLAEAEDRLRRASQPPAPARAPGDDAP